MREMDAALDAVYQASVDPGHWSAAMARFSALFGGLPTLFMMNDTRTGALPLRASFDIDPAAWEKFERHYATLDANPTLAIAMTIPLDRAVDQAEAVGEDLFRRSAINDEVFAPQGHWPFVGTVAARSDSTFAGFSVMRRLSGDRPDREHFQIAEHLSAHVGRALALSGIIGGKALPAASFAAALDRVGEAMLILDPAGRVVWRNAEADRLFLRGKGVTCRSDVLTADDAGDQRRLSRALEVAVRGRASVLMIPRLAEFPYVLRIQRLWRAQAIGKGQILVKITRARRRARFDHEEAIALFGLTAAEARVACEVCASRGIDDTARKLEISPNTVKSLLRRCFEKLGVRSQGELALLFATSLQYIGDFWG